MQIEVGTILEGTVTGLTNFGAFISLPDNKNGMVHISEVSTEYVKDIREHLEENQKVTVKVISVSEEGKIGLSIRKAIESTKSQNKKNNNNNRKANVWQGQAKQTNTTNMSFEDMMAKFKQDSEEKMSDLKRSSDSRYGNSRRGNSNRS